MDKFGQCFNTHVRVHSLLWLWAVHSISLFLFLSFHFLSIFYFCHWFFFFFSLSVSGSFYVHLSFYFPFFLKVTFLFICNWQFSILIFVIKLTWLRHWWFWIDGYVKLRAIKTKFFVLSHIINSYGWNLKEFGLVSQKCQPPFPPLA